MSEVELRQVYREKLYNYRPPWILRWGVTFFFLFLLLIIVVSGFIKYPDVVPATAEITAINPPAHLVARVNGKIEDVFVTEGQSVAKNNVLVSVESPVNWTDVEKVQSIVCVLDSIITDSLFLISGNSHFFNERFELGELQRGYSDLMMNLKELNRFYSLGVFDKELNVLRERLKTQEEYQKELTNKKELLESQFVISKNKFRRDSLMFLKGGISQSELERSRQNILQFRTTLTDMNMSLINGHSTLVQMNHEIDNLILKHRINKQQLYDNLKQSMQLLSAQIETWKQNYLLVAPVSGRVSFTTFWSKNQNIKAGEVVVSVVPEDSIQIKVRLQFPVQNSGKVKVGQRVNIKLSNYPFQEFGMLIGSMANVSRVPNNLQYSADVNLENGLVTSYGIKLPKVQQLTGAAEIYTDESSLLMRFFNPLKALLDEDF